MVIGLAEKASVGEIPLECLALHRLVVVVIISAAAFPSLDGFGAASAATGVICCRQCATAAHLRTADGQTAGGISRCAVVGHSDGRAGIHSRCRERCRRDAETRARN